MSTGGLTDFLGTDVNRREVLRLAVAGALLGVPWAREAQAAIPGPPKIQLQVNRAGDGVISRFGEVRVGDLSGVAVPVIVTAAGKLAVMDLSGRSAFIRFGSDASAITVSSAGVQFGSLARPVRWSRDTISRLIDEVARDPNKARGAVQLRSAMLMSYPSATMQIKKRPDPSVARAMARSSGAVGADSVALCVTTTIVETVFDTVTRVVEVWKSAEEQFKDCYDREIQKSPCKDALFASSVCAATFCGAKTYVDMLISSYEVVEQVAREVVRKVTVCAAPLVRVWPNPWDVLRQFPDKLSLAQPRQTFTPTDLRDAIKLLKDIERQIGAFLGPFGRCLMDGQWSLAALDTRIDFGDGTIAVPYGVKVCISRSCATQLTAGGIGAELAGAWGTALAVLAALSPEFLAYAATIGIVATPGLAPLLAAAGPVVQAAAALILAFIILALIYGTAIVAQMTVYDATGILDSNGDGRVCIEHASFALALIKIATLGVAAAELIPPVVNPA